MMRDCGGREFEPIADAGTGGRLVARRDPLQHLETLWIGQCFAYERKAVGIDLRFTSHHLDAISRPRSGWPAGASARKNRPESLRRSCSSSPAANRKTRAGPT